VNSLKFERYLSSDESNLTRLPPLRNNRLQVVQGIFSIQDDRDVVTVSVVVQSGALAISSQPGLEMKVCLGPCYNRRSELFGDDKHEFTIGPKLEVVSTNITYHHTSRLTFSQPRGHLTGTMISSLLNGKCAFILPHRTNCDYHLVPSLSPPAMSGYPKNFSFSGWIFSSSSSSPLSCQTQSGKMLRGFFHRNLQKLVGI